LNDMYVPYVVEKTPTGEKVFDLYSRLLEDRIVILGMEITDSLANLIIAELLFLEAQDRETEVQMFINSPGGSVTAGLAIYDTMQYIKCPVSTICIGQAASMGAVLLAAGEKGRRFALPHSRVLIHQPLGDLPFAQAADIKIHANEMLRVRDQLNKILADHTGRTLEHIAKDTDRDYFMPANEALEYGIVDKIIESVKTRKGKESAGSQKSPK